MDGSAHSLPLLRAERLLAQSRGLIRAASHLLLLLAEWQERAEQRSHLANMDDAMLKDVGINAAEAWRESRKPFWRS
ncbi:MAG: DUF1127 domain-containing protein [Rhodospirillaceae bacterium]|nr:DUF1127 domain-containing protein [Rhodospirillaceae bacterium]